MFSLFYDITDYQNGKLYYILIYSVTIYLYICVYYIYTTIKCTKNTHIKCGTLNCIFVLHKPAIYIIDYRIYTDTYCTLI